MNQTQYNRKRKARHLVRLPVSALIFICNNHIGWVGWCPLNGVWCCATWGLGYTMRSTLGQALRHIRWSNGYMRDRFIPTEFIRVKEVRQIGDLLYSVGGSTQDFRGQAMVYDPHEKPHLRPLR